MKTAIVYVSNHGATERVANQLANLLAVKPADVINLRKNKSFNPEGYERVLIGGSIHVGQIQKPMKQFCNKYTDQLLTTRLGLFVCCMYTDDQALQQFELNFPELLRKHSTSNKIIGGAFDFEKMNWFEKIIVRKVAGVNQTTSNLDESKILEMAEEMNRN
ncbi:MAG: hypothetical protein A2X11_07140 [Bacteroidetes bacterium GWE2_42_24]|nr:MAG: hypothetical protein A2X11_07140 [Bacteroidetes bacterium GWE2_42_24]OFY25992.1 MAG: hypothetical protein A2X09_04455 [Bacteroidetes bacterium GWF2_43_11]